ncbi:hypothetical protein E5Q_01355 [Mixia osmundae IAM 14324]|uniref:Uncharacterized protein n=1 Tax=Mixia osmundae (strain CBS 9802 / IAM 14324 / JCM 22182 / KY 12970) TaxID=764103 RepID=G7DVU2_MIXOS|nr:hypothetical protein E5Q_01355 [Mixia osmundae IAM 14324]
MSAQEDRSAAIAPSSEAAEHDKGQKIVDNTGDPESARDRQEEDDEEFKKRADAGNKDKNVLQKANDYLAETTIGF